MNMKKFLLIVLSLAMILTGVLVPVSAGESAQSNNSAATVTPTVGYSQAAADAARIDLSSIPSLKGVSSPSQNAYQIDSLEAYENFVSLVNSKNDFKGKTVYLACDLDLSLLTDLQTPIGFRSGIEDPANTFNETARAQFCGTFDGQGYEISGVAVYATIIDSCYSALFGWVNGGTIQHLKTEGFVNHDKETYPGDHINFVGTGGLIGCADGATVVNNVYCNIGVVGCLQSAGIVGRGSATVTNCTNAGDVYGSTCAGGIGGFVSGMTVINSLNIGHIVSPSIAGGILARTRGVCNVNGSVNDGCVENSNNDIAGGIIGRAENESGVTNLVGCINYGQIKTADNKSNAFGHTDGKAKLNVDASCESRTRAGYSTDRIWQMDLIQVTDLASVSTVTKTAYRITNAQGLIRLSELVKAGNTFSGVKIYLDADIDMKDQVWEPIGYIMSSSSGTTKKPFSGVFDGQGHTISNLVAVQNTDVRSGLGLFGFAQSATIQNVILDATCSFTLNVSNGYNGAAAVLAYSGSSVTVTNVMTFATVIGKTHSAGIVARGDANAYFCTNYGYISGDNCAGGISAFRTYDVRDCVNYGTIHSTSIAGGVAARIYGNRTYRNLINHGTVIGKSYAGGVIGRTNGGAPVLENCANYGMVSGLYSNGLYNVTAGVNADVTVTNCTDRVTVGYSASNVTPIYNIGKSISKFASSPNEFSYFISTPQELVTLSELVQEGHTFKGVTIYLMNDLNMRGVTLLPIGYGDHAFAGMFDGRGCSISNLKMNVNSSASNAPESAALFGLTSSAQIKNLILDDTCFIMHANTVAAQHGAAASILAKSEALTYVCNVRNCADVSGATYTGGIAGRGEVALMNCSNRGDVVGGSFGGGLAANVNGNISASENYGSVRANVAGGAVGFLNAEDTFYTFSYNYGTVMGADYAGGLVGVLRKNCQIQNCANYGAVGSMASADAVTASVYNVESGYTANVTLSQGADRAVIGFSSELTDGATDPSALLSKGLAKNIEDYQHTLDAGKITHLIIDSASDMALFSKLINTTTSGEGMTFCLAANVDMNIYCSEGDHTSTALNDFAPIGSGDVSAEKYFAGIFDGMGHTISNLHLSAGGNSEVMIGLFGKLSGATVKNLIIDESCSFGENGNANTAVASLAPVIEHSTVQNVWTRASVASAGSYIGGMACIAKNSVFVNCTADATVVANSAYAGGFVGEGTNVCYYNCRNLSVIEGVTSVGAGFTANDKGDCIYSNCTNLGSAKNASVLGALAGAKTEQTTSKYVGCFNYGFLDADSLVGRVDAGSFEPMKNTKTAEDVDNYHFNHLLGVKSQTRDNGDGTFDLRLIATVDSLNYQRAGFRLIYNNSIAGYSIDIDVPVYTVYTSILENGKTVSPTDGFADTSRYFILHTVENIPDACKEELTSKLSVFAKAYLATKGGGYIDYCPIEPIVVPEKLTPTIETNVGIINRFDVPNVYEIGNTGVTVNLQYHAWPSVTVDENGVLYAFASARLEHVDPFGHTLMYKSFDGGKTWSKPYLITDTPMDDRDVGVTYMGNGKMLITYFRIACASLMKTDQSFTTADGKVIKGNGTYTTWQKHKNVEQKHIDAVLAYWSTLHSSEISAQSWCRISEDYGATWTEPITTPLSTPHGPILLRNGNLLYVGRASVTGVGGDGIYAFISTDGGYTWNFKAKIYEKIDATFCEPHVVELSNGRWLVAIRVQDGGFENEYRIYTCYSDDKGETWTQPKLVTDKNGKELYGTPPQLIQLDNGAVVMTYASRRQADSGEYAIISYDGGMTWDEEICLCLRKGGTSDIGYPMTVHLGNGELVTVYYQAYETDSYCSFLYTKWSLK